MLSHLSEDGEEKPIAFASRNLCQSEQNYSMIEKEALTIIFGIKEFHQYLFGQRLSLLTDHKPLTYILGPKRGIPALAVSRLQWWFIQLASYTYHIEYRASKYHGNAAPLSHLPRKLQNEQMIGRRRETKSIGSKLSVHPLQPVELERLQEAIYSFHLLHFVSHGWPVEENTPEELRY